MEVKVLIKKNKLEPTTLIFELPMNRNNNFSPRV